jgi:hypothetical protein
VVFFFFPPHVSLVNEYLDSPREMGRGFAGGKTWKSEDLWRIFQEILDACLRRIFQEILDACLRSTW